MSDEEIDWSRFEDQASQWAEMAIESNTNVMRELLMWNNRYKISIEELQDKLYQHEHDYEKVCKELDEMTRGNLTLQADIDRLEKTVVQLRTDLCRPRLFIR